MKFKYKAATRDGHITEGIKESKDSFTLHAELKSENLILLAADPITAKSWKGRLMKLAEMGSVSMHEKIIFGRNLASMLDAGLSLSRAISVMARQNKNKKFRKILNEINENVSKGDSLSKALKRYPKVFPELFISMVTAGEESGNLVESLNVVAAQMEKSYLLKKKVKGALVYPGVIISAMAIIGIFMLVFVVPTLTSTFADLNVDLPATTQFIIWISDFVKNNLLLAAGFLVVLIISFIYGMKTPMGRKAFHYFVLHIPLISSLVKQVNAAQTARTLASLLSSGVPFVQSLEIVHDVLQNTYYRRVILEAQKKVQLGQPMSKVFIDHENLYPAFVGEMIAVGEETGELSPMLLKVAAFYESEVEQKTKNMSTIIEPVLMIIVGIAVGFFAISMISPMYSLVEGI